MLFDSLNFSIDENSYCWVLTGTVSNKEEWTLAVPGLEIEVHINFDSYIFIIDSRERDESFDSDSFTITARSKTSIYGVGSDPIYKTWGNTTAHDVITELVPDAVITIPNWNLQAELLSSDGDTAISIVSTIAEAVGGIVYTDASGLLHVVPKYKVAPANYNINDVDIVLSDLDSIYQLKETKELQSGYNQVQVSDEPDSSSSYISLSEHSRDLPNLSAVIKVIIYPFVVSVSLNTSRNDVVIGSSTLEVETLTETIEIVDGEGSLSNPITSINSSQYLDADMGVITFSGQQVYTEMNGTTLVEITYNTQYHLVPITSDTAKKIQLYMEEL